MNENFGLINYRMNHSDKEQLVKVAESLYIFNIFSPTCNSFIYKITQILSENSISLPKGNLSRIDFERSSGVFLLPSSNLHSGQQLWPLSSQFTMQFSW